MNDIPVLTPLSTSPQPGLEACARAAAQLRADPEQDIYILQRLDRGHAYIEIGEINKPGHRWCYFDAEAAEEGEGPNGPPRVWVSGYTNSLGVDFNKRFDHFEDALGFMLKEAP